MFTPVLPIPCAWKNGWDVLMYIAWVEVFEGTRNINVKPIIWNKEYLKVFKISKDVQDHSGIFRHLHEQIDDEFFLKQLNWWMEHGTQTTLNMTNLRLWPNYARPFHSFRISRWPSPNYPPQCYCRPSQELANRPGHTCQRRNDLRSFGLQQLKYRLGQRFKQRQLEQERQPLLISHGKNVATQIK